MAQASKSVLIAGATGYLGRHLISAYHEAGYKVVALARRPDALLAISGQIEKIVLAQPTKPETLKGVLNDVDHIVSALGITRQTDGLSYDEVDYQANRNLLDAALAAGLESFTYIHVKSAELMPTVEMAAAKARFAAELDAAPIRSTIVAPSGFYSDLAEVFEMARKGRVYLFGNGESLISPIDGRDLAIACVKANEAQDSWVEVGGPQTFTLNQVASSAFEALAMQQRITHLPSAPVRLVLRLAKWLGFGTAIGPLDFFLAVSQLDMSAPPHGSRTLTDFFQQLADEKAAASAPILTA